MGYTVGDTVLLYASLDPIPSVAPGIVSLDIGNGFTTLFALGSVVVAPTGYTQVSIPTVGLPPLTTFYVQSVGLPSPLTLPVPVSNTQEVLYNF